jgi:hypothetical protein
MKNESDGFEELQQAITESRDLSKRMHPLEDIAMRAFAERDCHDSASLGYFLAGGFVHPGAASYRTVAKDVLGYMKSQGKLRRDELGWYRRVVMVKASDLTCSIDDFPLPEAPKVETPAA